MPVDVPLSIRAARAVRAKPKECYINAWRALSYCPELEDCLYVEGYILIPSIPFATEHGWLETPDGTVVDPTLYRDQDNEYFAGLRFTLEQTLAPLAKRRTLPLFDHYRYDDPTLIPFGVARAAAWAKIIPPDSQAALLRMFANSEEQCQ